MNLAPWLKETFEPSLLMSVLLVGLGGSISWYEGYFSLGLFLLVLLAAVLIQNSVNVLNDYHDFVRGVDQKTEKTPFSGGSRLLVEGTLKAKSVFYYGIFSMLAAAALGFYLAINRTLLLIPLVLEAVLVSYSYTPVLARNYLGEFFAGLNLGPLSVLGTYMVLTSKFSFIPLLYGIAPGMMIANVLLMNEIPDIEADSSSGRRNLATFLGSRRASWLVLLVGVSAYFWSTFAALEKFLPTFTLLTVASFPVFLKAALGGLKKHGSGSDIAPSLGLNIIAMLLVILFLVVSVLLSKPS